MPIAIGEEGGQWNEGDGVTTASLKVAYFQGFTDVLAINRLAQFVA